MRNIDLKFIITHNKYCKQMKRALNNIVLINGKLVNDNNSNIW